MGKTGNGKIKDDFIQKIRVPRDLKQKIKGMAAANRRSMANEVIVLLELAVNTHRSD